MSLRLVAKMSLSALAVCAGALMLSPQQQQYPQGYSGNQTVYGGPGRPQAPIVAVNPPQQAQRIPGQAYSVRVVPCGEFGKPACGTVVTIPGDATGESLWAMVTTSVNAGRTWEAMIYISEAAGMGYVKAEAALGADFGAGAGVPLDLVKARYWLQKAADQGDGPSQAELGEFYEIAEGGPPDMVKAIHYFDLSAAQHVPRAERDLGLAYELGIGVAHDRAKAIELLRRAAADDRRFGFSPARPEAYANALSRAGSRRFASSEELAAFVYPAPRQTQTQTQRSNVPNGCPEELNYPVGQDGFERKAQFCLYHPGCPVQVGGIEQTCLRPLGPTLYQIYHDN
jgi:hypothetical protein